MLIETDFYMVIGTAIAVVLIFIIGYKFWEGRIDDEKENAISNLKMNILATGFLSLVLWFMLPSTPSLQTFGYPETVSQIESGEQMLQYLQRYNRALVRTTDVMHWFIFIFVWGFLSNLYYYTKVLRRSDSEVRSELKQDR